MIRNIFCLYYYLNITAHCTAVALYFIFNIHNIKNNNIRDVESLSTKDSSFGHIFNAVPVQYTFNNDTYLQLFFRTYQ